MTNYDRSEAQVTGEMGRTPRTGAPARRLADAIEASRVPLGASWWKSARTGSQSAADADPEAHPSEQGPPPAEPLLCAIAGALRGARRWHDHVMRAGWSFGVMGHSRRVPLYFVLEDLDLLEGLVLGIAYERARDGTPGAQTSHEAFAVARRAHEAASLLRLSAVKGYTQSVSEELRRHFQMVRHELRNPLGTIKSALALMEDETIPAEMREGPRFRALARKNATSMEAMIRTTLGDSAALLPAFAHEPVSLRAIASAVKRDMSAEAESHQAHIVVGDALPTVRTDSAWCELTLKSVVAAVLRDVDAPSEVLIDLAELSEQTASVRVSMVTEADGLRELDAEDLAFARDLAARAGGRISRVGPGRQVCVDVPVSVGEEPHDVGGARERHHG